MNKNSRELLFLWLIIAASAAGLALLVAEHLGAGTALSPAETAPSSTVRSNASVPMQSFSNDGYVFSVPAGWNIERTGTDTIALHPDAASPGAACKIEVFAFPFSSNSNVADWIAQRIGADPSLDVVEQSSGDVSIEGGTGVQWVGTIDGIPTTLIYAFNDDHAYEIAPSVIGKDAADVSSCSDILQTFLSGFTI